MDFRILWLNTSLFLCDNKTIYQGYKTVYCGIYIQIQGYRANCYQYNVSETRRLGVGGGGGPGAVDSQIKKDGVAHRKFF